MDIFSKFQLEFKTLVDATWEIICGKQVSSSKSYIKLLHLLLHNIPRHSDFIYGREDVEQEIRLAWIIAANNHNSNELSIQLKHYLIHMAIWHIRNWLKKEWQIVSKCDRYSNELVNTIEVPLDLKWIIHGSYYPWNLTGYERYLLYMKYIEGISVTELGCKLQCDRRKVTDDIVKLINKLRSLNNEEESI